MAAWALAGQAGGPRSRTGSWLAGGRSFAVQIRALRDLAKSGGRGMGGWLRQSRFPPTQVRRPLKAQTFGDRQDSAAYYGIFAALAYEGSVRRRTPEVKGRDRAIPGSGWISHREKKFARGPPSYGKTEC